MSDTAKNDSLATWVRNLSLTGGVLALISLVCGVVMLILKGTTHAAPEILSQVALILFPIAFVALMAALAISVVRRRRL